MKARNSIYYLAGESLEAVQKSPLLEQLKARDLEVVFMVDPVDEYLTQNIQDYENKKLVNIAKEGLKFGDEDDNAADKEAYYTEIYSPLTAYLKKTLGNKVEKVAVSNRLATSPESLAPGWTTNMERIMKAQALADPSRGKGMQAKRILEINPLHPLIASLNKKVSDGETTEDTTDVVNLLYEAAAISSGFAPDDNAEFVARILRTLNLGVGLPTDAALEEDSFTPRKWSQMRKAKKAAAKAAEEAAKEAEEEGEETEEAEQSEQSEQAEQAEQSEQASEHIAHDEL
eukprot:TRINITY_DN2526_c0_g1_i4.p1 TRINITY_DN2526_c0_g1~~TRINITY_DN2526_c0_g1_i4.p1  ORF type:complete len:287 (-),score=85.37 TRINITY_DN2526_c0_g1_i4:39-899(-)